MDITVTGALLGTVAGVSISGAIAWMNQKAQQRRELTRDEMNMRQTLYGDFIAECARLLVDAYQRTLEKPETFVPVYGLINRIRLCATKPVVQEAEKLIAYITEQYFSSNLSLQELRELARSSDADALKAFGEACRAELKSMRTQL